MGRRLARLLVAALALPREDPPTPDVKTWASLLGCAGVLLISIGAFVELDYAGSVMLEIGATLFLAIPLVLLEDILENVSRRQQETVKSLRSDLHQVTREVKEARSQIEELGRATKERISAERDADVDAIEDARGTPPSRTCGGC